MSDAGKSGDKPRWVPSPLLQGTKDTPRFLRAPWDVGQAQAFGPWRIAARTDPSLTPEQLADALAHPSVDALAAPAGVSLPEGATPALGVSLAVGPVVSADQLQEAQDLAHARGLAEGAAQARAEWEAERAREGELLRHLSIEMRALSEDPDRFFEPLRRLALHIAEQLVRSELQVSGNAISQIVRQCLSALDQPSAKVVIHLHPDDVAALQTLAPTFLEGLRLQAEPQLLRGSVRLRIDDTVMEDLIENRLEALVQRLMVQPGTRTGESVLLRDASRAPADTPLGPRRGRPGGDIIDATIVAPRKDLNEPPHD